MPSFPAVFTIPPGVPFLPTLADAILAGRFGPLADPARDPLALAGMTVLLPTRRSARALREIFLARSGGGAAILPRIRPIGDVDEDAHLLEVPPDDPAERLLLPPAVSRLERLIVLSRLVLRWGRAVRREMLRLGPDEPLLVPASAADAVRLAGDLARLMDDMASAGIGWDRLAALEPADYPGYWQLTLDFLKIAGEAWPAHLAEQGLADPVARRDALIRAQAARLAATPPDGPVVAAGSTGSIPATAELLATIARLPEGAVVLPGLDQEADENAWSALGDAAGPGTGAPSHPQYGLRQLLGALGVDRGEVLPLADADEPAQLRAHWVSEALRPAETTEAWAGAAAPPPAALDGLSILVARNEQEEALAIATALRESVETKGRDRHRVAALATPDRALARRVSAELRRWGLDVDDSAGRPLESTPAGVFARLLAEAALAGPEAVTLLAVLKHPLAAFGMSRAKCRRAARILEVALFRGARLTGGLAALPVTLGNLRLQAEMKADRSIPRARRRLHKGDWTLAEELSRLLATVLGPLEALAAGREVSAGEASRLLAGALEAAAADPRKGAAALWDEPDGEALAGLLAGLADAGSLELDPAEYPGFLAAAMRGVTVTPRLGADPRIHIWGALEARLQSVDLMILGGLDEGVWPAEARTDPWLSRRMRTLIGLPPPERRIGLAAHDFAMALGTGNVILSRAEKRGGAPTVPSRWLQRLLALTDKETRASLHAGGERLLALARTLDHVPQEEVRPARRPAPAPPVAARPREISVTGVEKLIRDPYAIYARRILQLEPLEEIGRPADARLRGTLIHDALADFTRTWPGPFDERAEAALRAAWERQFREVRDFPEVHAVWSIRSEAIIRWIVDWEARRDPDIASRHAEIAGRLVFDAPAGPYTLNGRADRIDIRRDGRVDIFDYKTGQTPSTKQVLLFAPQLALEAAMVAAGGFGDLFAGRGAAELAWIALAQAPSATRTVQPATDRGWAADALGAEAFRRLQGLVAAYDDPAKPYVSKARPMFERRFPDDYDHLARVAEWRLNEDD